MRLLQQTFSHHYLVSSIYLSQSSGCCTCQLPLLYTISILHYARFYSRPHSLLSTQQTQQNTSTCSYVLPGKPIDVSTAKTCSNMRESGRICCGRFIVYSYTIRVHYDVWLVTLITITWMKIDGFGLGEIPLYTCKQLPV